MKPATYYLTTTATPEAAVALVLADATAETARLERYYRLLLRALRNAPALPPIQPAP